MSVLVAGLCYEIAFGCPKRKAVAVALADHASHDGTKVFPSVALIAKKVEFSERTVQRTLRELEALGVLVVVSPGGAGPKDTREWYFDLHLLRDLAAGHAVIRENKGDSVTPLEGDCLSPLEVVRVTEPALRVTDGTAKGDSPVTRTVNNHQLEPSTREGARATESAARPRLQVARLVTSEDDEWRRWMVWLTEQGRHQARDQFEAEGEMVVFQPFPSADTAHDEPKLAPTEGSPKRAELIAKRIPQVRNPAGADA